MSVLLDNLWEVPVAPPLRVSALLCYPVEWLDPTPKPAVEGLHCTLLYIPDATLISKGTILDAVRRTDRTELGYSIAKVKWASAFGPENDVPVLELDLEHHWEYKHSARGLEDAGIGYDKTWAFMPHVTVDLNAALNPPKKVLLRPLELWYQDDEPVVV